VLGDLWKWDGVRWIFLSGNLLYNQYAHVQFAEISPYEATPGNRYGSCYWKTKDRYWLFSGRDSLGLRNDIWSYHLESGWAFEGGSLCYTPRDMVSPRNTYLNSPSGRFYASCWFLDNALHIFFGTNDADNEWKYFLLD